MFPDVKTIKKLALMFQKKKQSFLNLMQDLLCYLERGKRLAVTLIVFGYNLSEEIDDNAIRIGAMLPFKSFADFTNAGV